jgi:hypothetical protein
VLIQGVHRVAALSQVVVIVRGVSARDGAERIETSGESSEVRVSMPGKDRSPGVAETDMRFVKVVQNSMAVKNARSGD